MKPSAAELRALARRDPVLGRAMARAAPFPGFPRPGHYDSHFHALAASIISQQLSTKAAATIAGRVRALTPGPRFPPPEALLDLSDRDLRAAGLSGAKTAALRDLATKALDGTLALRGIARHDDETVIERLVTVRGIGVWTAHMFLIFRLGRLDVMPTGDLGVREGARRLDGLAERPGEAQLLARSEPWRPLRSVASWVLWRLLENDPVS